MAEKSHRDLEYQLRQARAAKEAAEDRLSGERTRLLEDKLAKAELVHQELQERLEHAVATRDACQQELDEAMSASDDVETLNEEISNTSQIIEQIIDRLDQQASLVLTLEQKVEDIRAEYDVQGEELAMAKLADEYVNKLEAKLGHLKSELAVAESELADAYDEKQIIEEELQEAVESKKSVEYILEDVEGRSEYFNKLTSQLSALNEDISEKNALIENQEALINELRETLGEVDNQDAGDREIMAEYTERVGALEEQLAAVRKEMAELKTTSNIREDVENLVRKIYQCMDYQNVYALENDFNKVGLSVQTTSNGRMVLCKLQEGKIVAENVVDDFIFIGSIEGATKELSERAVNKIQEFVRASAGSPGKVMNMARVWRNGLHMYESTIPIMNEEKKVALDVLIESGPEF